MRPCWLCRPQAAHRGGGAYKRAIPATAHKLLRVIYSVLRHDRPYTDPGIDYEKLVVETQRTALDSHAHAARLPDGSASRNARLNSGRLLITRRGDEP